MRTITEYWNEFIAEYGISNVIFTLRSKESFKRNTLRYGSELTVLCAIEALNETN